jgi:hypothetical protein
MTLWLVGVWQCWPIARIKQHPLFIGVGVLLASYGSSHLIFNTLFDFSFLNGAPIYIESLDPKGLFMAWQALAFGVTTVAVIMFCIICDFWPISPIKAAQNKTWIFGLLATSWVLTLAAIVFTVATHVLKIDYVVYMARGPVSFIFGAFIVLNMLQNSVLPKISSQPLRGLLLAGLCIVIAAVMQTFYGWASHLVTGPLSSGAPAYEMELWLANAMLALTFPIIVCHSDFFNLWPLAKQDNALPEESSNNG